MPVFVTITRAHVAYNLAEQKTLGSISLVLCCKYPSQLSLAKPISDTVASWSEHPLLTTLLHLQPLSVELP